MGLKDEVGAAGEELAAAQLINQGFRVLARNWCGRGGELDIVALDGRTLCAVEVKTRSTSRFGHPAEAITDAKMGRIKRLLGQWVAENRESVRGLVSEFRIDVVAVTGPADPEPLIEHLKGVS